jgi:hypothetical protein
MDTIIVFLSVYVISTILCLIIANIYLFKENEEVLVKDVISQSFFALVPIFNTAVVFCCFTQWLGEKLSFILDYRLK